MFFLLSTALSAPEPPNGTRVEIPKEPRPSIDFVLLWADAKLMRAADGSGSVQVAPDLPREPGNWLLARVIDKNAAGVVHLGLAPHTNLAEHCVAAQVTDAPLDLEVWAFEQDLQPVVTTAYTVEESSLVVRPGVPLVNGLPWMGLTAVPMAPPEGTPSGRIYRPDAVGAPTVTSDSGWIPSGAKAMMGEAPVSLSRRPGAGDQLLVGTYDAETKNGTFQSGCGSVTVQLETPPNTSGFQAIPPARRGARPHFYAKPGTPVVWPDGTTAGKLSRKRGWADEPESEGDLRCWNEPVGEDIGVESEWRLCIAASSITER